LVESIAWINNRCCPEDVAREMQADAFSNPQVRGASRFYISSNPKGKSEVDLILNGLLGWYPEIPNRGAKADTEVGVGSLGFCRRVTIPSLLYRSRFFD
jgi:hypothetical protein